MSATDTAFAGSIPSLYDRYLGPLIFEPYAEDLAARLRGISHGRILETAAGTGIVTRAMVKALPPDVEIVASDLNKGMLDVASRHLQAPNVRWQQLDAQALPFEDAAFDAVVCQFGAMFFPDKVKAFREAMRVLKPGGCYLFSVWDRLEANPVSQIVQEAVAKLFPENPPLFYERVPFGCFDTDRIIGELQQAGFEQVAFEPVEKVTHAPTEQELAIGLCQGTPLRAEIEARVPDSLQEATDAAAEAIAARFGSSSVENRMRAFVFTARR